MARPPRFYLLPLWLAFIVWVVASPLRAQSPAPPLTLAEYRAEVAAALAELEAAPEENVATKLGELQEQFAAITQVEFPNGEQVALHSILADLTDIGDGESDLGDNSLLHSPRERAVARLRGTLAQIDASANDDTAARLAILATILARPEFNTPMSLWDRFLQWLENLLSEWLPDSPSGASAGWLAQFIRLVPWIIATLIVAAVIWLLSYWLQRFLRAFVTDARIAAVTEVDDLPNTAAEARQQARAAAQSGRYRDAVRRLYLAALLQLSEHDLITFERSLTNREVLVRVPNDSPIRPHLEPVIATFDQVWYGVREPDQATFSAYEQEIDTLSSVAARTKADSMRRGEA